MTSSDWNSETSGTVVAYFSNGEDAQNAINELVDEGIPVSEIGAAFHGSAAASAGATESPTRPVHENPSNMGSTASGAGVSGAESDTSGVTPAGLSTGSGTGFAGAGRPGPIPGSEIPGNLPHEVPSTLRSASTAPLSDTGMGVAATPATAVPVHHEHHSHENASWWDKLKHLFSGESAADTSVRRAPVSDAGSRKFGTGEGELGIAPRVRLSIFRVGFRELVYGHGNLAGTGAPALLWRFAAEGPSLQSMRAQTLPRLSGFSSTTMARSAMNRPPL